MQKTFDGDPALFLQRWGRFCSEAELREWFGGRQASKRIANRRFAHLRRSLHAPESDYFSDEAMRMRDPSMYEELVGRFEDKTEQKPFKEDQTLLDRVFHNLDTARYQEALEEARSVERAQIRTLRKERGQIGTASGYESEDDEGVRDIQAGTETELERGTEGDYDDEDYDSAGRVPGLSWATSSRPSLVPLGKPGDSEDDFEEEFEEEEETDNDGDESMGGPAAAVPLKPAPASRPPPRPVVAPPTIRKLPIPARMAPQARKAQRLRVSPSTNVANADARGAQRMPRSAVPTFSPISVSESFAPARTTRPSALSSSSSSQKPPTTVGHGRLSESVGEIDLLEALDESSNLEAALDMVKEQELARRVGREDLIRVMEQRFLGGGDLDFNYASVDNDPELDDLAAEERDLQERYFADSAEEEDTFDEGDIEQQGGDKSGNQKRENWLGMEEKRASQYTGRLDY
ncbi:hypothetical protein HDU93_000824 [Gonapodya sp. JEL0774]|nr:hypothetical protein HDU93_000824 [Gonapodya sp. JEL0774]